MSRVEHSFRPRIGCGVSSRAGAVLLAAAVQVACSRSPSAPAPVPSADAAAADAPPPVAAPRVVTDRPPAATWDADRPPYASPGELCAYLNAARVRGKDHQRFRGEPWRGAYHETRTWPVELVIDAGLGAQAQAEADRLARDGGPPGRAYRDSAWRRPVWIEGIGSERQLVVARDVPGDWDPARNPEAHAALIDANGAVRLGLLHQDGGADGPALRRMGCGAALAPDGRSRWWVVLLAP